MNKMNLKGRLVWSFIYIRSFIKGTCNLVKLFFVKTKKDIIVILTGSIGDDVYGLSYIHELKKSKNKRLIIYCLESKRKLVENYKVADDIRSFVLGNDSWRCINYYRLLIDLARMANIYSILPDYYIPMEKNGERSCLDILKYDMLKVGKDAIIQYPDFSNEKIVSISNLSELGYRTIILNYSSKSMSQVDISLFQTIADDLSSKGYTLYTNVVEDQKPLIGTKPLNCSIYELFAICNRIKAFISVRSGILDFCANTNAPFLVYNFPFKGGSKRYNEGWCNRYNLKAWGKENIVECFVSNDSDALQYYKSFCNTYLN